MVVPPLLLFGHGQARPLFAIFIASTFGFLGFLGNGGDVGAPAVAFAWLSSFGVLACIIVWASICWCHIMFRWALEAQGHHPEQLAFRSGLGIQGSWTGLVMSIFTGASIFYTVVDSEEGGPVSDMIIAMFCNGLSPVIALVMYLGYKFVKQTKLRRAATVDLVSGRRIYVDEQTIR